MNITVWLWVHVQTILVVFYSLLALPSCKRYPIAIGVLAVSLSLLPVLEVDLSSYLLPMLGFLSLTSILLLINSIGKCCNWTNGLRNIEYLWILSLVSICGLILYPTTLWFGNFWLYSLGFTNILLPLGLGIIALIAWTVNHRPSALLLLITLWAWLLGLSESQNLWNYLIDPWLVIYAWSQVGAKAVQQRRRSLCMVP